MKQVFPELRPHFNLRMANGGKPSPIYLVVSLNGKQYKIPTGVKVRPSQWDKRHQRAIVSKRLSTLDNVNNKIANEKIDEVLFGFKKFLTYICNSPKSWDEALPLLYGFLNIKKVTKKQPQLDIIQFLSDEVYNRCGKSAEVYLKYVNYLAKYLVYRKAQGQSEITTFKELATSEVFRGLQDYFAKEYAGKLMVGYVNEMMAKYKTLLYYAINETKEGFISKGDIVNVNYRPFADKSAQDNKTWLANDEVTKLCEYQCANEMDEHIKDLFLLECTTGHRLSDIQGLAKDTRVCESGLYFDVVLKKTSQHIRVPMYFDLARQIIKKYPTGLPQVSNSLYNRRIKGICKDAGIDKPVKQAHHYVGEHNPRVTSVPKYEIISSHTGRHTFVSLLALRGLNNDRIGKYTGQSAKTVERYLKALSAVDYEAFRKQQENTPEVIVRTIEEVDAPQKNNRNSTSTDEAMIREYQNVLVFLGAAYEDVCDIRDIDTLSRMLYGDYERKLIDAGANKSMLKELFNKGLSLKERKALLRKTVEQLTNVIPPP